MFEENLTETRLAAWVSLWESHHSRAPENDERNGGHRQSIFRWELAGTLRVISATTHKSAYRESLSQGNVKAAPENSTIPQPNCREGAR